ncbi:hypothetical protein DICPUDRAFT_92938 [Dictyostelium purpureum]|uniref:DH domain-containing protein n=1 Tax=Dictyostelium purpureum TaxID=5786 RepID=F0ZZI1_DICPU|nr:uncharacterized protein DICPUDRAFT_92938 [Dictyostelium purpureum]EGC30652.1 hypothetical protein DICPUDRAFT_92938 [Dictyostelium purpureum]|eukprot:XP_003292833.1 hypothetical protein DICPUDRAFT_92938 [Dictyostelium purpureum]
MSRVSCKQPTNKILARKTLHATTTHSSPIVSKNSHRHWCIVKVQSVIRRWLAVNRYKKMLLEFKKQKKQKKLEKEKLEKLEKEEQQASAVINYSGVCNGSDNNNNSGGTISDNDSSIDDNDLLNKSIQSSSSSSSSSSSYGDIVINNNNNNNSSNNLVEISVPCSSSPQSSSLSTASSLDDDIGKLSIDEKQSSSPEPEPQPESLTPPQQQDEKEEAELLAEEEKEKLEKLEEKTTNNSNSNNTSNTNNNNNNNNGTNKKIPLNSRSSSTISMSSSLSSSSLSSSVSDSSASLSSSISSSQEKSSPHYLRKRTLDEMLRVERGYVQDMTTLIDVFLKPFRDEENCFPKHHLYTLFCNIEDLRDHHQRFLDDMEKKFEPTNGKPADLNIGDLFLPFMGSFQKLYEIYINNYEKAFALTRYFKINPNFQEVQKLIYQKEKDPRCRHLDFNSFLVIPVQRLPRYIVLLKEIEKNTPTDIMDYNFIALSLVQLQDLTLYLNESKRKSSNSEKIEDIKNTVFAANPIIGHSKYVMEGQLSLLKGVVASTKKDLYIYLFKECILCTEVNPNYGVSNSSNLANSNSSSNLGNSNNNSPTNLTPKKNTFLTLSTSSKSSTSTTSPASISPNSTLTNSVASSVSSSGTPPIHNGNYQRIIFKTIFFSDVKTISLLKNFKDSFQVVTSKKVYTFVATSSDRERWVNSMNDCISNITPPPSPTMSRSNRFSVQLPSSLSPTLKKKNRNSVQLSNSQNS